MISAVAVIAGIKVSQRNSKVFPYGLYKAENVVAVIISLLISFTGYEILREVFFYPERDLTINLYMLCGILVSILLPFVFSRYEMRVGQRTNS